MPALGPPWHADTNAPDSTVAFGHIAGDIFCSAASYIDIVHNFVHLTQSVTAPPGANAVNVRLERSLLLTNTWRRRSPP